MFCRTVSIFEDHDSDTQFVIYPFPDAQPAKVFQHRRNVFCLPRIAVMLVLVLVLVLEQGHVLVFVQFYLEVNLLKRHVHGAS